MKKKLILGVTGGFGTGKSTVSGMFKGLGAYVIDADALAHKFMQPKGGAYKKIVSVFGQGILKKDSSINRRRLASVVFADKKRLSILIKIIHPMVIKEIKNQARIKRKSDAIVIDVPLLIESGLGSFVDKIVVVKTDRETQAKRCLKKGFSKIDIKRRTGSQLSMRKKIKAADFIIDNSGAIARTKACVLKIWEEIKDESR